MTELDHLTGDWKVDDHVWRIRMLGSFQATKADLPLRRLRSRTCLSLLAYLALSPGREFSRLELAAILWPDSVGDRQDQNIRRCISDLRQALESETDEGSVIVGPREFVALDSDRVETDVQRFQVLARLAQEAEDPRIRIKAGKAAAEHYRAGLLVEFSDSWIMPLRFDFEDQYAGLIERLLRDMVEEGEARTAASIGRTSVLAAPLREDLHIALMEAYIASGLHVEAIRQYEELERVLEEQWGEAPSDKARETYEQIPRGLRPNKQPVKRAQPTDGTPVFVTFDRNLPEDCRVASAITEVLLSSGYSVATDIGSSSLAWARRIDAEVRNAAAVVAIVSSSSSGEVLRTQLASAHDTSRPVITVSALDRSSLANSLQNLGISQLDLHWRGPQDNQALLERIREASVGEQRISEAELEAFGGAVPLDSRFYVAREADSIVEQCINRQSSGVILIKGPRQIGKTSLLQRGIASARHLRHRTALCDFQTLSTSTIADTTLLYGTIVRGLAKHVGVEFDFNSIWCTSAGPNENLDECVERILLESEGTVVWAFDEVDRLFGHQHASDFFGLLRSWFNRRTLDPDGPWNRLLVVITYATEAYLFISNLDQSPFNVGIQVELRDFSVEQLVQLSRQYGLSFDEEDLDDLYDLTGGHPYLARKALDWLIATGYPIDDLLVSAYSEEGPFADHLKRLLLVLTRDTEVLQAVRKILAGESEIDLQVRMRMQSAGILARSQSGPVRFRTAAYRSFLSERLLVE